MIEAHLQVREWSRRFRQAPLAQSVVAVLDRRSDEIWRRTFDLLRRESPEYRNAVDDEFTKESQSHCRELLRAIIAISQGRAGRRAADPFGFVRTHAEWRTRHQVPLAASLHAYRLAHKTYWDVTREALLRHEEREEVLASLGMLSDFWLEFFDYVGAVLEEATAAEQEAEAAANSRVYGRLLGQLLRGLEPRSAEARRLRTLSGMRPGTPMAVAVGRPLAAENGNAVDLNVARRSLARLIQQVLPSGAFGKLVEVRRDEVTALVSSDAGPSRALARLLRRHGPGRRAAIGVSRDAKDVAALPESLEEARLALEFAGGARPLVHFPEIDLTELLVRRADRTALRLIPDGVRQLSEAGGAAATLRAFANCSLNVKQTARRLGVHPNTVYFRLNRIQRLTGVDPRTFAGMSLLTTSLRLLENQAASFGQ
jgi:hypothetical protein